MHSQPLTPPPSGGDGHLANGKKINLDLRIGNSACPSEAKGVCFFTDNQFHEFCRQIFVYNLTVYGFPVAFHFLIPSFSSFNHKKSDHSSVMDPEPGRCRRTDGRKWRCSKNVVPLQKYCERHMHRGRQGSRKPVETIERVSRRDSRDLNDRSMSVTSFVASTVLECRDDKTRDALFAKQNNVDACDISNGINSGISVDYARSSCSSSRFNHCTSGGDCVGNKSISISSRKQNVVGSDIVGFTSSRLGLSPNSVLIGAGKVGPALTMMEVERQRCRRTDGKKWQCRRDALPAQKYCQAHMHRGAKRHEVNPDYSKKFRARTSCAVTRNLDSGINLNTVPASPQHADSSSTTSDATTISDENISFCVSNPSPQ